VYEHVRAAPGSERLVTPEAVPVWLDVAGIASRAIATIIDSVIIVVVMAGVARATSGVNSDATLAGVLTTAVVLSVLWGYYMLFEGLWRGRTPGKAAQHVRVVRTDGQPVGWLQVVVRNLLRPIDLLPGSYLLGAAFVVLTGRSQRLGDLAAGTLVVRDRRAPAPVVLGTTPAAAEAARTLDASALREREYGLIRSFLERRQTLSTTSRRALAGQLASMVRDRVPGTPSNADDESVLEATAAAYRGRFSSDRTLPPPPSRI
jgi:uncharacterized RDD family membrane protein YckC